MSRPRSLTRHAFRVTGGDSPEHVIDAELTYDSVSPYAVGIAFRGAHGLSGARSPRPARGRAAGRPPASVTSTRAPFSNSLSGFQLFFRRLRGAVRLTSPTSPSSWSPPTTWCRPATRSSTSTSTWSWRSCSRRRVRSPSSSSGDPATWFDPCSRRHGSATVLRGFPAHEPTTGTQEVQCPSSLRSPHSPSARCSPPHRPPPTRSRDISGRPSPGSVAEYRATELARQFAWPSTTRPRLGPSVTATPPVRRSAHSTTTGREKRQAGAGGRKLAPKYVSPPPVWCRSGFGERWGTMPLGVDMRSQTRHADPGRHGRRGRRGGSAGRLRLVGFACGTRTARSPSTATTVAKSAGHIGQDRPADRDDGQPRSVHRPAPALRGMVGGSSEIDPLRWLAARGVSL